MANNKIIWYMVLTIIILILLIILVLVIGSLVIKKPTTTNNTSTDVDVSIFIKIKNVIITWREQYFKHENK